MWQAGVGDGRIRVIGPLEKKNDNEAGNRSIGRLERLRAQAQSLGGTLIVEQAPARIKTRLNAWGLVSSSAGLVQRVKQQLDPDDILSPGRF
jgi:glycolate oxidase FAD binding subunit